MAGLARGLVPSFRTSGKARPSFGVAIVVRLRGGGNRGEDVLSVRHGREAKRMSEQRGTVAGVHTLQGICSIEGSNNVRRLLCLCRHGRVLGWGVVPLVW